MMKEMKTGTYFYNDESYNFNFTTSLSTYDKLKFVNSVTDILVSDSAYNLVLRNLVFNFYIIDIFTDVDTKEFKESSFFVDDVEKFLEETNIVDIVNANVEIGLIDELNHAVDLNIQYLTGIHPNPLNEALSSLLSTLETKINEVDLGDMMGVVKKFANISNEFTPENVVNAYMNSDVHRQNLKEIEESKKSSEDE